ncbi:MAG: VanZ family protein [Chloroflexi bacterium]|nr:VanZ family protein [Chloroflexota bacterium]
MKVLAALFALFIVAVIALADTNRIGFLKELYDFPHGDKAGHFILYGILSFLLNASFVRALRHRPARRILFFVSLLLALAIGIEEWSQVLVPGRTPDWCDLLFSYLGVAAGAWMANRFSAV